jgi:hypothetical protein
MIFYVITRKKLKIENLIGLEHILALITGRAKELNKKC